MFLKPKFFTPRWVVVLSEYRADVLAPMAYFKKIFLPVILMSLWLVLLLSLTQIRRNLVPLEKLQEGTRRIARREFDTQVAITSGDEFQDLATSFNTMARRLGRQFSALTTMDEIDRAILSASDTEKIVDTVLTRMREIIPCDSVNVTLLNPKTPLTADTYIRDGNPQSEKRVTQTLLTPEEVEKLQNHPESLIENAHGNLPGYLGPLSEHGMKSFLVLPIFLNKTLSGIICLGHLSPPAHSEEDLLQARQVADQVAVALSNAHLIERLDRLSWGTLVALARAIDAKSPWTFGHSERVTNLAVEIGRAMGLNQKELEIMHRGGLIHDIGKIGVPASILDKPGKLNDEEIQLMRNHVRLGVRILEPVPEFSEVLPIVLHHHEWLDGSGYPDGLAGEEISLYARIFAVADCFDALAAERPYRAALPREHVIEMIKKGSGRQYDPKVVEAFLEVMAKQERESIRMKVKVT